MTIYLIKRQPRPEWHKAPYHPVVLCTRKDAAKVQAGDTTDQAMVWEHENEPGGGWLLMRWMGLDIDYGYVVKPVLLPDGSKGAFFHDRNEEPWTLLNGATWWSPRQVPLWLQAAGVKLPEDEFSQSRIQEDYEKSPW